MKTTITRPVETTEAVFGLASSMFCDGHRRGLEALTLANRFGVDPVLQALRGELRQSEISGSWSRWDRFQRRLGGPPSRHPDPARRIAPIPSRNRRRGS